jgi:xanthine dehydrogenase accessory factor
MWNWVQLLEQYRKQGQSLALVTVTQCTGSTPRETGAKMIVLPSGKFHGTIGGGHLEELALKDAVKAISENTSSTIRYPLGAKTGQCCGGVVELLIEAMNAGPHLYLFGAGHVGQAVCRTFVGTPFNVHVIDEREEWVMSELLPAEVIRHHVEWDDFARDAVWDPEKTYVAVMTHRHDLDQDIIEFMVQKNIRHLGLIGSRSKWERFQQRLTQRGVSSEALARVKCPIGIDIGGKAPQEIAVSIAAEFLQIHYGK